MAALGPPRSAYPRRFAGRTVLVTGAGTRFGAEIAVRAAQEGARVVVHYNRSREGAEQTAARIEEAGSVAALAQADITSWDQIKALADAAFAAFGGLDVAVNNVPSWSLAIAIGARRSGGVTAQAGDRLAAPGRGQAGRAGPDGAGSFPPRR